MEPSELARRFATLTTAHLADGCLRAGAPVRCGPPSLRAAVPGARLAGRVLPVVHTGSVDVFLEALEIQRESGQDGTSGEVLVVDNGGRRDESCVGDLVVLEAQSAGLAGVVIWGLHRDTTELQTIGLPVFSTGSVPTGPLRIDPRPPHALRQAQVGEHTVTAADLVFGDQDGVLFVPAALVYEVITAAEAVRDTERRQADRMRAGHSLRQQVRFDAYLEGRRRDPSLTFRDHLRAIGGAIEV